MCIRKLFSLFLIQNIVVDTQKNSLNERVLLSTQNTCLNWLVRTYLQFYANKISSSGSMMTPWCIHWTIPCSPNLDLCRILCWGNIFSKPLWLSSQSMPVLCSIKVLTPKPLASEKAATSYTNIYNSSILFYNIQYINQCLILNLVLLNPLFGRYGLILPQCINLRTHTVSPPPPIFFFKLNMKHYHVYTKFEILPMCNKYLIQFMRFWFL